MNRLDNTIRLNHLSKTQLRLLRTSNWTSPDDCFAIASPSERDWMRLGQLLVIVYNECKSRYDRFNCWRYRVMTRFCSLSVATDDCYWHSIDHHSDFIQTPCWSRGFGAFFESYPALRQLLFSSQEQINMFSSSVLNPDGHDFAPQTSQNFRNRTNKFWIFQKSEILEKNLNQISHVRSDGWMMVGPPSCTKTYCRVGALQNPRNRQFSPHRTSNEPELPNKTGNEWMNL